MKNKKLKLTIVLILMIAVLSAVSYGAFFISRTQEKDNRLLSGCFSTSFTDSASINMSKALPMSDTDGLKTNPYTFTIKNTCSINADYAVLINVKTGSFSDNYISYNYNGNDVNVLSNVTTNNTYAVPSGYTNSYIISRDTLVIGDSKTYSIKLWLNENADYESMVGKNWQAEIRVVSIPSEESDINIVAYTINGSAPSANDTYETYYNAIGTTYGADIICKNGSAAIVNSKGQITFTNTVPGDSCTINFRPKKWYDDESTLGYHMLMDNPNRDVRTAFGAELSNTDQRGKLFTTNLTEDKSMVYYYAGGLVNNWVVFGKCTNGSYNCKVGDNLYWRIIRTNTESEGGGLRLIYFGSGSSSDTVDSVTNGFIGSTLYNYTTGTDKLDWVGYMYSSNADTDTAGIYIHNNDVNSTIKTKVDSWYETIMQQYDIYINKNAIYCNDRSYILDETTGQIKFGYLNRALYNGNPTLKCGYYSDETAIPNRSDSDKLTGLGAALITADELAFVGVPYIDVSNGYAWPFYNSSVKKQSDFSTNLSTDYSKYHINSAEYNTHLWTMSPATFSMSSNTVQIFVKYLNQGNFRNTWSMRNVYYAPIVPVISLKGDALWASGDGSASNPYKILKSKETV